MKRVRFANLACLGATVLSMLAVSECQQRRTAVVYEIPEGYRGWVEIDYERSDCPALPLTEGKYVIAISKDGRACTSSAPEVGTALDEFYFVGSQRTRIPVTGWGGGGLIWGHTIGTVSGYGSKRRTRGGFFVGSESEYRSAPPAPGTIPLPTPVA